MTHVIFFSWQSDTSGRIGRNFVSHALQDAVASLQDAEIEEADREGDDATTQPSSSDYAVDMDTKGVSGSPPIVETIFKKIDAAAIFVADLTFVGSRLTGNPTPNPNVLIEYGWALKRLGYARIISVMNTEFGDPREKRLPFDLEHLRHPLQYRCSIDADDETRREARRALSKNLEGAIKAVVGSEEFKKSLPQPAPLPLFQAQEPKDGRGRFRAPDHPLGANDGLRTMGLNPDVYLINGAVSWLRVMPEFETKRWSVAELWEAARSMPNQFMPHVQSQGAYRNFRAGDGFGMYGVANEHGRALDAVFAFCTGEIWSVDAWQMAAYGRREPPVLMLRKDDFTEPLVHYAAFLSGIGAKPPYRWIAGVEGTKGRHLAVPHLELYNRVCLAEFIEEEGVYTPDTDPKQALLQFFSKIYDACGMKGPE